jgi:predicted PurR-regulated permease PerM
LHRSGGGATFAEDARCLVLMNDPVFSPEAFRRRFLLLLTLAITALFATMVGRYLTTLLLAAILSGMSHPLYRWLKGHLGGRSSLASVLTVIIIVLVIVGPTLGLLTILGAEGAQLGKTIGPWLQQRVHRPSGFSGFAAKLPFAEKLAPYADEIRGKLAAAAERVGIVVASALPNAARGAVEGVFQLFLMLYATFFFLCDGRAVLNKILYYLPLGPEDEERILDRFVSVTRAMIKGALVIGIVKGTLAGAAFWVAGIKPAVFWGAVMGILSFLPAVGAAFVWIPAVIVLLIDGRAGAAVLLFAWCAGVVEGVDNVLRPRLVGKDTQLPPLLVLLSTLGGIVLFGAAGVIIGPIVASLLITIWDIYGAAFKDILPPVPEAVASKAGAEPKG